MTTPDDLDRQAAALILEMDAAPFTVEMPRDEVLGVADLSLWLPADTVRRFWALAKALKERDGGAGVSERGPEEIGHIVSTPHTLGGQPRLAGTRIQPQVLWNYHVGGYSAEFICQEFPSVTPVDVLAAVAYCEGYEQAERERKRHKKLQRWKQARRLVALAQEARP